MLYGVILKKKKKKKESGRMSLFLNSFNLLNFGGGYFLGSGATGG